MNFWELDMSMRSVITLAVLIVLCLLVFAVLFAIDHIRLKRAQRKRKIARARERARARLNRQRTFVNCWMDEYM